PLKFSPQPTSSSAIPPEYFATARPQALEDKISNIVYATRMSALNAALHTNEMRRSMRVSLWLRPVLSLVAVGLASAAVVVNQATNNAFALVLLFLALLLLCFLGPSNTKYSRKCEEMAQQWTQEDGQAGINLQYVVKVSRKRGFTSRLEVLLVITERAVATRGGGVSRGPIGESLPLYFE
ncbi:hypothetical protein HDU82_003367, partial [Entophlyctis luteolus]